MDPMGFPLGSLKDAYGNFRVQGQFLQFFFHMCDRVDPLLKNLSHWKPPTFNDGIVYKTPTNGLIFSHPLLYGNNGS